MTPVQSWFTNSDLVSNTCQMTEDTVSGFNLQVPRSTYYQTWFSCVFKKLPRRSQFAIAVTVLRPFRFNQYLRDQPGHVNLRPIWNLIWAVYLPCINFFVSRKCWLIMPPIFPAQCPSRSRNGHNRSTSSRERRRPTPTPSRPPKRKKTPECNSLDDALQYWDPCPSRKRSNYLIKIMKHGTTATLLLQRFVFIQFW